MAREEEADADFKSARSGEEVGSQSKQGKKREKRAL